MDFEEFAAGRLPALLRYAVLLTGDGELARDVVQEVLARALLKWRRVSAADEPYAYVRTMITNEYLSLLRRRTLPTTPLTYEALNGPHAPNEPDPTIRSVQRLDLWHAISTLPRHQRAVIVLRYYEGLPDAQIAETLGCRPGTVRGYAHRALSTLRINFAELATNGSTS